MTSHAVINNCAAGLGKSSSSSRNDGLKLQLASQGGALGAFRLRKHSRVARKPTIPIDVRFVRKG